MVHMRHISRGFASASLAGARPDVSSRRTRPSSLAAIGVGVLVAILMATTGCGSDGSAGNSSAPIVPPGLGDRDYPYPSGPAAPEVDTADEPRSTFAIDVDTASYNFARRQILDGQRPDRDTIRPEEFVNAFRQDYPQPDGDGFTVNADGSALPRSHEAAGSMRLLRIGLQTGADSSESRPDAALTFVIDVSGSMAEAGRLDLVQGALHTLV